MREYCDKNYHQILPILAEKLHQEKAQQEKLKAVKAHLNFEEASRYSESETPSRRRNLKERLGPRYARTRSESPEPRRGRSKSSRKKDPERRTLFTRLEKGVFHRLGDKEKNVSAHSRGSERKSYYSCRGDIERCYQSSGSKEIEISFEKHRHKREYSRRTYAVSESEGSAGGHWKSKPKKQNSSIEEDLSQPWENVTGKLPPTKKCIKDPVEIHNIKQRYGESTEEFVRRNKLECMDVKGASECMKISEFMHGITNPELIKRLHDKIPKSMDEMMSITTAFLRAEANRRDAKGRKALTFDQEIKAKPWKREGKDSKKGETSKKDIPLEIVMVQPWQRTARQRITQTFSPESIISFPTLGEEYGTEGPMIIEADMGGHCIHRIYVDGGSSSEIFGKITLSYNRIIGRPWVRKIRAIPSTTHGMIKFPVAGRIVTLRSSRIIPLECSMVSEPGVPRSRRTKRVVRIVKTSPRCVRLVADMTGVPRHIAEHRIHVRERCLTIRQKKRGKSPKRNKAISEEVKKLVEADIMKEVLSTAGYQTLFMSKSAEKSFPFFKTLKKCTKKSDFQWTAEAEVAFKEMKQLIVELPMLTVPREKEELIMYLAAAKEAIGAVLMTQRDGKQVHIYFVSRALQGPEINYTPMEKLIIALVSASKQLKRYFQAHTIVVITDQPIKQLLSNPEVTGRLLKWRFELKEHDIQYRPRTSVKGQILVDFIVERPEDDTPDTSMEDREELPDPWILFMDGSSCIDGSEAGLIIMNPEGMKFTYALMFRFNATNNKAEYEALIAGLRIPRKMGVQNLQANVDSKLIANQVNGIYIAKESSMIKYLEKANYVLREIHEGSCSMHAGPRSVVAKALRSGPSKVKFLIVAVDYFTKWIEARPVATITGAQVKKFVWDNIVCRFGLPGEIVSENEKQFRDNPFKDWCEKLSIRQCFASVKHPQANSLVEEVSHVLWAHHTMIKSSNGETPFSSTYGAEAVIPAEIGMPTLRTTKVDMVKNNEALGINLDLLEEKREQAAIQKARNKAKMERYYNARVRSTSFCLGDFVYRSNEVSHAKDRGKLGPKWEGAYEVTEAWAKERTGLETAMDTPFREHGISVTLKSVIYMKCKHPLHVKQSGKEGTDGILFDYNIFKFLMNEKVKPIYLHPFLILYFKFSVYFLLSKSA
nr:reverse transcriptase domain-containing protein [Tanacetum cinerariifolium]